MDIRKSFYSVTVLFAIAALFISMMPLNHVHARMVEGDYEYETINGEARILNYIGSEKDLVIPEKLNERKVTSIYKFAFRNKQLTSVIIPDSVNDIWEYAFSDNKLQHVTLSKNLNWVSTHCFSNNQLTEVTIPNSVRVVGAYAFSNNQLTSIDIPDVVSSIGKEAFYDNELTSVVIPDSLKEIGDYAFSENKLNNIMIPNTGLKIGEGAFRGNQLSEINIPNEIGSIGSYAFSNNRIKKVTLPDKITHIPDGMFISNQLTNITIPENVTSIGHGAFSSNQLTEITIPNKVTSIGASSFSSNQLKEVVIPGSVTEININAFSYNPITKVTIFNSTTKLGDDMFFRNGFNPATLTLYGKDPSTARDYALKYGHTFEDINFVYQKNEEGTATITEYNGNKENLVIPHKLGGMTVTHIGDSAFANKQLTEVTVPNSVKSIGKSAFESNQLTSIAIPDSVTSLGESAFANNQLESLTLSKNISHISNNLFYNNQITELMIPNHISSIGESAFANNQLKDIIIPEHVTNIGKYSFANNQLSEVTVVNDKVIIEEKAFDGNQENSIDLTIGGKVPSKAEEYARENKHSFKNIGSMPIYNFHWIDHKDGTATISKYTGTHKNVVIPEQIDGLKVIGIGASVFESNQLTKITIPDSVISIGDDAFTNNDLIEVFLPNSVNNIGKRAFANNQIKEITIVNQNATIGDQAFAGNQENSSDLTIKGKLSSTAETYARENEYSFKDIGNIAELNYVWTDNKDGTATISKYIGTSKELIVPGKIDGLTVNRIGDNSFTSLGLTKLMLPNSVTSIGQYAFAYNQLREVTIPNSVISIGHSAFFNNQLREVTLPNDLETIEDGAFATNQLTEIAIPDSVRVIKPFTFQNNKLKKVNFPNHLTEIEAGAFQMNELTEIIVPYSVTLIGHGAFTHNDLKEVTIINSQMNFGGAVFYDFYDNQVDLTIKGKVPSTAKNYALNFGYHFEDIGNIPEFNYEWIDNGDGTATITKYTGTSKEVSIPNQIDGLTVSKIGNSSFAFLGLTTLTLPNSVTSIGDWAFAGNQLKNVSIPDGVTSIGDRAFYNNQLKDISIPDSVTSIGDYAFTYNELSEVVIPNGVTNVAIGVFEWNQLTKVILPNSVTEIQSNAFSFNQLNEISLPNNIKIIGVNAFSYNRLKKVAIPNSVTSIGQFAFAYNQLLEIAMPNGVSTIGEYAFAYNQLSGIVVPNSVISIEGGAFAGNQLTEATIVNSKTAIKPSAFMDNKANPADLTIKGKVPSTAKDYALDHGFHFEDIGNIPEFNYEWTDNKDGTATITKYTGTSKDVVIPEIIDGLTVRKIGDDAFYSMELTKVTIPKSVTVIGDSAFSNNTLKKIVVPDSIIQIQSRAFSNNNLTEVTIKSRIASIGEHAFAGNQLNPIDLTIISYLGSNANSYALEHHHRFVNGEGNVTFSGNENSFWAKSHSTKIEVSDYDEMNPLEYAWSANKDTPKNGWSTLTNGSILFAPTETGEYYLHVRGLNFFGQIFNKRSNAFLIDNTNPNTPTITAPITWHKESVHVTITDGLDEHSGTGYTQYRINNGSWETYSIPITVSTNGETIIDARTIDKVGNVSPIASAVVKIDQEKPLIRITPSTTKVTHEDIVLTIEASDAFSGIQRIQDPNGQWHFQDKISYTIKDSGSYTFVVEDNAGNVTTEEFVVSNIDKTISFEIPTISKIKDITITEELTKHTTNVTSLIVKDWRDGRNDWRIDVSASRVKMQDDDYELPAGTLKLKPLSEINQMEGTGNLPTITMTETKVIDNGKVTIAKGSNSRGEFDLIFPESALEFWIDPITVFVDDHNGTKYKTTITWELITAP